MLYSEYDPSTNLPTGCSITIDNVEVLALNTKPGMAWYQGALKYGRERLVFNEEGLLVPESYIPEQPSNSEWLEWIWDSTAWAWLPVPTLKFLKFQRSQPILKELTDIDIRLVRPVGEIAGAIALGQPAPEDAMIILQQLESVKVVLRKRLDAIEQTVSKEELEELDESLIIT